MNRRTVEIMVPKFKGQAKYIKPLSGQKKED
jgi:hypothetical protein